MKYRAEIDGLRAVAVVPVILFHAGVDIFKGGFVGVDVFFVISGYLIASILIADLERGDFSILRFYERRARRILPAMFCVMLVCVPFAWAWMLPRELENFSQSTLAVSFFVSNIFFWREVDYFAPAAEENPLLHTWSLAIEEQFYVIFPVALLLFWRFGRRTVFWLALGIAAFSLAVSEWAAHYKAVANFYLLPTRAWELLAGTLCALLLSSRLIKGNNALAALGGIAILASVFLYDDATPFPSVYALLPVGGTMLIILFATQHTWTARLLAMPPLVGIGLISYSAYLWHQPLFAFARIRNILEPGPGLMTILVICTFILAYLSWKFIEQPFRKGRDSVLPTQASVFIASLAGLFFFATLGGIGTLRQGDMWRVSQSERASLESTHGETVQKACFVRNFIDTETEPCRIGAENGQKRIVGIGDSHLATWTDALDQIGKQNNWSVEIYTKAACPVAQIAFHHASLERFYHECATWRQSVLDLLTQTPPDMVFLTNSSAAYINRVGGPLNSDTQTDRRVGFEGWESGLEETLEHIEAAEVPVIWLFDNPHFRDFHPLNCYLRNKYLNYSPPVDCVSTRSRIDKPELRTIEKALFSADRGATFVDFSDAYCIDDICPTLHNGLPTMRDNHHISTHTALRLMPRLNAAFQTVLD